MQKKLLKNQKKNNCIKKMKKYCVYIEYAGIDEINVEASNREEAKKKAIEETKIKREGASVRINEIEELVD